MKRMIVVVGAALALACGDDDDSVPAAPPLNPAFAKTWQGGAVLTFPGFTPLTYEAQLSISVSGNNATVSHVCFDGSASVVASGSGNTANWSGTLVCPPVPVGNCSAVTATYNSAIASLSENNTTLTVQASGTATGCGTSLTFTNTFIGM